jgi:antitoxin component YwqK of YwqJK toxin-antitoxin module
MDRTVEVTLVDEQGRKHGLCKCFWSQKLGGKLMEETNYRHGKRHGFWRGWHSNGKLSFEEYCVDDLCEGYSKEWHKSGRLWYEMNLIHDEGEGERIDYGRDE